MSSYYGLDPIDLSGLRTVSLYTRGGKVQASDFARTHQPGSGVISLLDSLPRILAAQDFRAVIQAILSAKIHGKPILWGIGGHVIKCGLAPIFIDLMRQGFATGFAMNGAASIHDFEIALAGYTSEDVESVLPDGQFGSSEETGLEWNKALLNNSGAGESLGFALDRLAHPDFAANSLLLQAWRNRTPVTVHVAIGTDTTHTHPAVDPAVLGRATYRDFLLFAAQVAHLGQGGIYINVGSAVIMPEVFLKALSSVRNLGAEVDSFTTVNFDFLQHYRPRMNVIQRPHAQTGGKGYAITGHHELMIPLLAACLSEAEAGPTPSHFGNQQVGRQP